MEKTRSCVFRGDKKTWELLLNTPCPELLFQEFHPISQLGKAGSNNTFYWELPLQVLPVSVSNYYT